MEAVRLVLLLAAQLAEVDRLALPLAERSVEAVR